MELLLRAALLAWLNSDPWLPSHLNAISEEAPLRATLPWLAIATSASTDWGCKTTEGREVRIALELHCRGDAPSTAADLVSVIERRIQSLPSEQTGFQVCTAQFLRARAEQRPNNLRAILLEYRFRLLAS